MNLHTWVERAQALMSAPTVVVPPGDYRGAALMLTPDIRIIAACAPSPIATGKPPGAPNVALLVAMRIRRDTER